MLKQTILAIASLTTLAVAVTTAPALAQRQPCTAGPYCGGENNPGGGASTYSCTEPLGHLRRVYREELEEISNPNHVSIMPICVGESYGVFRNDGNAGSLRTVIAENDAMTKALFRKNFGSDDVVGIRIIGESKVILYVHPFHHY